MALSPTWLLQELEDPFLVFPVQSVGRSISTSLKEADENLQIALTNSPRGPEVLVSRGRALLR